MISKFLFNEIKVFAIKPKIKTDQRKAFVIKMLSEISKFKYSKIAKVSDLWKSNGAIIITHPFKKYINSELIELFMNSESSLPKWKLATIKNNSSVTFGNKSHNTIMDNPTKIYEI